MNSLEAARGLPVLAQRAMRAAILAAMDRGRFAPRAVIDDALVRFASLGARTDRGAGAALLFAERDRIVRELRRFIDGRIATRLSLLRRRDIVALGRAAAPFDAIVRARSGAYYALVFRRVPRGAARLVHVHCAVRAMRRYDKTPLGGVLLVDFGSGGVRLIRGLGDTGAEGVYGDLGARREVKLRKDMRNVVLHRLVGERQTQADLLVGESLGDQPYDLQLAVREDDAHVA